MKYIRTKDGSIFETYTKEIICLRDGKETYHEKAQCFTNDDRVVNEDKIIKQADTIEELCDEFVIECKNENEKGYVIINYFEKILSLKDESKLHETNIYGAIWTYEGLIFVAKMNSKGELELS